MFAKRAREYGNRSTLSSVFRGTSFRRREPRERRLLDATDAEAGQKGEAAFSLATIEGEKVENVVPLAAEIEGARSRVSDRAELMDSVRLAVDIGLIIFFRS